MYHCGNDYNDEIIIEPYHSSMSAQKLVDNIRDSLEAPGKDPKLNLNKTSGNYASKTETKEIG